MLRNTHADEPYNFHLREVSYMGIPAAVYKVFEQPSKKHIF